MATVTNQTQLRSAIQSGSDPEILVANDITMTSFATVNRSVTIRSVPGNPTATLFWAPSSGTTNQYMFRVYSSGNLMADNLTMDGQGRNCGLVRLSGGTFTMNDGVTLTGIRSNTANSAVLVGDMTSTVGGTFIMNGGLITGIDAGPHTTVFCAGGTVEMSGDAAIENNPSAGLTAMHNIVDNTRSTVRITGNARIANNSSGQSGGGIMLLMTDAVIGESENDAPSISSNYSPYHAGGILLLENSRVTIGGKTEISGNSALLTSGGILALSGSSLRIGGDVKVNDNKSGANSSGIGVGTNATALIEGNVEISGNIAGDETIVGGAGIGSGGGIMLQTGASLEIKGNVSIHDNTAENGGGIYLMAPAEGSAYAAPTAVIGTEDSSPSIYENTAANLGGGIFIEDGCELTLAGHARTYDNRAVTGRGIYNDGILKVAGSAEILDGLYFDCVPADGFSGFPQEPPQDKIRIESDDPVYPAAEYDILVYDAVNISMQGAGESPFADFADGEQPLQCGKAPIIDETLTADAVIAIELSQHVTPQNVPLVIAYGDGDTIPLIDLDRAACRIPEEFGPGYAVMLTPDRDQVIIDAITYGIVYNDLYGAANTNPASYKINGLPIIFIPPGERKGYTFTGWRDAAGNPVTEIPEGSTGDLAITAVWQAQAYRIVYNDLYGTTHPNPASYSIENLPILLAAPSERAGYAFNGWRDAAGNPVTEIPEETTGDLAFTAVWQTQAYNIVYNDLYGTTHPNPASYSIENLPILLAAPSERAGYAFAGWRDAAGNPATEIPTGSTGDLAFTAVWQNQVYSIVYNDLFGTTHPNPASYSTTNLPILLAPPSERPGYAFAGWRDAAGNPATEIPVGSTGDLAFAAVWQAQVYNIVYHDLFGTTHPNPASYSIENLPILLAPPSERIGYAFAGWRDAAGNPVTEIPAGATGDLAFTATWQAQVYSIVYNDLFGCTHPNPASYSTENLPILLAAPSERVGYTFAGWRDAAGNPATEIPAGAIGNLVFTAIWQNQVYSIVYNDLYGTTHPNPASYSMENLPIPLAAPSERAGYAFVGWLDAAGNRVAEIPAGSTGNLAFTAIWQAQAYRIVYNDLYGTTHPNPAFYSSENLPILLAPPSERAGYAFVGWRDAAGNLATEIPAGAIGDLAFTAVWAELSLFFDGNAPCVCNVPSIIRANNGVVQIPCTRPCRACHIFVCWNESDSGNGKAYCPGDSIYVSETNVKLYAQWQSVGCCRG